MLWSDALELLALVLLYVSHSGVCKHWTFGLMYLSHSGACKRWTRDGSKKTTPEPLEDSAPVLEREISAPGPLLLTRGDALCNHGQRSSRGPLLSSRGDTRRRICENSDLPRPGRCLRARGAAAREATCRDPADVSVHAARACV